MSGTQRRSPTDNVRGAAPVTRRVLEGISGQPDSTPAELAALGTATD